MENIKTFEQHTENFPEHVNPVVTVEDLIRFLRKFEPETKVILDKDGWQKYNDTDSMYDIISQLFDDSAITHRGKDYLIVNN